MTNIKRVTRYMEFGRQGALNQGFLIAAVSDYAESILANKDEVLAQNKNSMISGEAWVACAQEWVDSENYPPNNAKEVMEETGMDDEKTARKVFSDYRLATFGNSPKVHFKDWWKRNQKRYDY